MKVRTAVILVAAITLAMACRANESLEGQATDAKIATQIKSKLASEVGASTIMSVSVNVTNGVVTLAGEVPNASVKADAADEARKVEGVVRVNNNLQVKNPPSS